MAWHPQKLNHPRDMVLLPFWHGENEPRTPLAPCGIASPENSCIGQVKRGGELAKLLSSVSSARAVRSMIDGREQHGKAKDPT
jgi:hypothetical protein